MSMYVDYVIECCIVQSYVLFAHFYSVISTIQFYIWEFQGIML